MSKLHVSWKEDTAPAVLNLDVVFNPLWRYDQFSLKFETSTFKGGEPHFRITFDPQYYGKLYITQRVNSVYDLMLIVLANDAARRMGYKDIELICPYFPAARQDRVCNVGEPLTVKVFADIINSCGFSNVSILRPHSDVTPALLDNVVIMDDLKYISQAVQENLKGHHFNIICPDAGAGKNVEKVVKELSANNGFINYHLIRCEKVRDVVDGSLKAFHVQADDLNGYASIILDDVLCLGGTFLGLGKKLREKNCGKLMLYTTHADCVEGIQKMVEFFDHVYTTNSKRNYGEYKYTLDDKFTCFNVEV